MGIGSMVGAGIFALMGQAALMAREGVYISFILGGVIALLSGYSYQRLATRYPGSGGIMDYFDRAFPSRTISGGLALVYLVTCVAVVAMVAKAFGVYAARLIMGEGAPRVVIDLLASAIVVVLTLLNMVGAAAVGRVETVLVAIKLTILALLMAVGIPSIKLKLVEAGGMAAPLSVVSCVGLTFLAYAGYGTMANASGEVANPRKTVHRAIFMAIGVVVVLYVGLALVVLGNVSPGNIAKYADTAVAQAARPVLGRAGFIIVSIAALLATASTVNAFVFSIIGISGGLAKKNQLPALFAQPFWREGTRGLLLAVAVILVLTNSMDLSAIANIASATFLFSYLGVFVAAWRLRVDAKASPVVLTVGFVLMLAALVVFLVSVGRTQPLSLPFIVVFIAGSIGAEWLLQRGQSGTANGVARGS